jgi:hypothetical protein
VERFIRCFANSTGVSFGTNKGWYVQPDMGNFLFYFGHLLVIL